MDIVRYKTLNGGYVYMKNNILMFSIFGIVIIYICMGGTEIYAVEETNSVTDESYTITIPREVQIPSGENAKSFDVTCNNIYKDDVVNVTVQHDNSLKNMNGKTTIPYNISFGNNDKSADSLTFTSDNLTNSINVHLTENGNVSGTYTDTLTFNISSVKKRYNLNIRGYLEGNLMQNIEEIADITVSGIDDSTSNGLQYNNVDSTTKYNIKVAIKEPSKYVLSEVKNNGKSDVSTGFTWNKDSNTITGTVAGDYASDDGTVYVDLYFVPKKYTLTFDANGGQFSDGTTKKTFEVAYDKPLEKIDTNVLNLAKRDPYYFGGWYKTTTEKGDPLTSSSKMPNDNLTLYAGWSDQVMVGLNASLDGESNLRGDLNGLGTVDFLIKNDDTKSLKNVTDINTMFKSTDIYELNVTPNYGYEYNGLSDKKIDHSNTQITSTTNKNGRLYDQPISLVKGTRYVSFNVMFKPIDYQMTFTTAVEGVKSDVKLNEDTYTFNQSKQLPSITSDKLKDGYQFDCWVIVVGNKTFEFKSGFDINSSEDFRNTVAECYKYSTGNITITARCAKISSSIVTENVMDDNSIRDLTSYSNVNDENSVYLQSNLNALSQSELGIEENKESEENTDGE